MFNGLPKEIKEIILEKALTSKSNIIQNIELVSREWNKITKNSILKIMIKNQEEIEELLKSYRKKIIVTRETIYIESTATEVSKFQEQLDKETSILQDEEKINNTLMTECDKLLSKKNAFAYFALAFMHVSYYDCLIFPLVFSAESQELLADSLPCYERNPMIALNFLCVGLTLLDPNNQLYEPINAFKKELKKKIIIDLEEKKTKVLKNYYKILEKSHYAVHAEVSNLLEEKEKIEVKKISFCSLI